MVGAVEEEVDSMSSVSWLGWNLLVPFKSQVGNQSFSPLSIGALSVGLYAAEELREMAAFEPAPSVPDSTRGSSRDCPSLSSLEAVPSVKDVTYEERSSSTGSAGPSLGTPPPPPPLHTTPDGAGWGWEAVHPGPAVHGGHSVLNPFAWS